MKAIEDKRQPLAAIAIAMSDWEARRGCFVSFYLLFPLFLIFLLQETLFLFVVDLVAFTAVPSLMRIVPASRNQH